MKATAARVIEAMDAVDADPKRAAFVSEQVGLLLRLVEGVEGPSLQALQRERGTVGALLELLGREEGRAFLREHDALAAARARGLVARRKLLEAEGGMLLGHEVAQLLGLSRQAVDLRRAQGKLFALDLGTKKKLYPAWQFVEASVLAGLEETLAVLHAGKASDWAVMRFFLGKSARLQRRRPLDCLREGEVESVVEAARRFDQHSAA